MPDSDRNLHSIRSDLDVVDERLVALVNERAKLAEQIGKIKATSGQRVYAPDRERRVLNRVCAMNQGPMPDVALRCVYRELMSASLALERTPRIAILGPPGSYSHLAGRRRFGHSVEFEPVANIAAVFDEVEHGHAEFALAPVENSIVGGVGETLDALIDHDVVVCGEVNLAVHHHLLANCPLDEVRRVYSKPEVFAQCHRWLAETGLLSRTVPAASTSAAAEIAAREPGAAAIAGDLAGELSQLTRIAEFVEDESGNVTRFLIIGTSQVGSTEADKTSIVFSVGDEPGRLMDALAVFREHGINMTRIESRPDRRKRWAYHFFVDIDGHLDTPEVADALEHTSQRCQHWKVLGSYPRAQEIV